MRQQYVVQQDEEPQSCGGPSVSADGDAGERCVEITARDAADYGYNVVVVDDACAAFSPKMHEAVLVSFQGPFGRVCSADEVIALIEQGTGASQRGDKRAQSLARLWQSQDKCSETYDLRASVHGWLTEGVDPADVQDANALPMHVRVAGASLAMAVYLSSGVSPNTARASSGTCCNNLGTTS